MPTLMEALSACAVADHYSAMFAELSRCRSIQVNFEERHLSHALYFQLCKIKYAAWKYRVDFKRSRRHSLADVFQDLIAFHLRLGLPENYEVCLETPRRMRRGDKIVTIQPDICIKRDGRIVFIVEAKTTIGWARPDFKLTGEAAYKGLQERITDVANAFAIPMRSVIFVFEEPTNVSTKHFLPNFWDANENVPVARPETGILAQIYPLYLTSDPYYWKWKGQIPKGSTRTDWYPQNLSNREILDHAERSIVTPFEHILKLIQNLS